MSDPKRDASQDRQWYIVSRWQEYDGEARANLLRVLAIGVFYVIELIDYYGLRLGPLELPKIMGDRAHQAVTGLAVAGVMVSMVTLLCLRRQVFPGAMKYLTTGADLVIFTMLLMVVDGPRSPMIVGYFLILALAALRLSLPLMWAATVGAAASYIVLLGYVRLLTDTERQKLIAVPPYHELIMLSALVLTGVILGQVIRRIRAVAEDYLRRSRETPVNRDT